MRTKGPQERLDKQLPVVDGWLRKGKIWHAREMLPHLRACVSTLPDELQQEYDRAVQLREAALAARMEVEGAPPEWQRIAPVAPVTPVVPQSTPSGRRFECRACKSTFRSERREALCDVCRPRERISVRTVRGGLPGLGPRR